MSMDHRHDQHLSQHLRHGLDQILAGFQGDLGSDYPLAAQQAIHVARCLQQRATQLQTPQERRQQAELDRMIHNPHDKSTLMQLTDQAFRSNVPHRAADQLIHILDVQGIPRFFSTFDRTLLKGFQSFGNYLPGVAVPLVKEKMQHETANVILPGETEMLTPHLAARRSEGVRMNVNYLGESLLGEQEAERRLNIYLQALQVPEIEVLSVKISTIYSQIQPLARHHSIAVLCDRLELLYRAAAKTGFTHSDGTVVPKFIYLDMEEYRDMSITAEAFMNTLDRPGLKNISAGIALQAYIPDSYSTQQEINQWARQRLATGGAPVTIRIVKGANMEMEKVEASLSGWPQAPYSLKRHTDANYKRMVDEGMQSENLAAVRLGIASHNLFDLAFGLVLAHQSNALDRVQFEMLEGMANHQRRALFELTQNVLLYAPACRQEHFTNAIGYLIRRLDENTGPDNFLRHAFRLEVDSDEWRQLENDFLVCFDHIGALSSAPRRRQDRTQSPLPSLNADTPWQLFVNEPDTDFSLPQNLHWAEGVVANWSSKQGKNSVDIPLVIDGQEILADRPIQQSLDPSRPGVCVGRYRQATRNDINLAV
ncbi:MAG: bifunctional proline dehydrogenase/L-glutamate gamma-semialdehyde dehydrogenase, partial [Planctomycetales bacterium]